MLVIGIDPGATGGAAYCNENRQGRIVPYTTPSDVLHWIKEANREAATHAYLEDSWSRPGPGGRAQGRKSSDKFQRNIGWWEGVLTTLRIPFTRVTAAVWMKKLGVVGKKKDATAAQIRAQELYPHWKISRALSDAVLICEYGWILERKGHGNDSV